MNNINKIKNLIHYTTINDATSYNGKAFDGAYHTVTILGNTIKGQRIPSYRLSKINYDFTGKTVLDIGANQGGMLQEIQHKIKQGIGVDFNPKLVNVANRISSIQKHYNLSFYHFDLSTENFEIMNNFSDSNYDVIFLLAVCMWIKNWKELIEWVHKNSNYCLFETNGKSNLQNEQINFLKSIYKQVDIIHETSDDDPKQKQRKTLWCVK